jgi:NADPH:quinone reductase-like Zn-dependent oxidoreductase
MNTRATALRLTGDFSIDALTFDEVEVHEPGPEEVLVRIRATSLNYRDLMVVAGHYNPHVHKPRVLGSDGAGEVIAAGSAVTRFKPGDRVIAGFAPDWISGEATNAAAASAMGEAQDGVLVTYRVFPEHGLVALPANFSFEEGATLPCAAVTAWHALVAIAAIGPADTVLLLGTGGVSIFGLQIAKLRGARTILTSSSNEKLARARELGADETINYNDTPEWDKQVRSLTHGQGVTHVLEVGGAGTLTRSIRSAAPNAQISLIGVLSGVEQPMDVRPILMKTLRIQGIFVGPVAMLQQVAETLSKDEVHPVIDRTYAFRDAQKALREMQNGSHFGKIVITLP